MMSKIAVAGCSGFIGSRVLACGRARGLHVDAITSPRFAAQEVNQVAVAAADWEGANRELFEELSRSLTGFETVVNAVGMARPGSSDSRSLHAANALQPAVLADACRRAGVRRLVHVSTAAVQGRIDPLDETPSHAPFSPYTRSKAAGERHLLEAFHGGSPEMVVYRPASVLAPERTTTRLVSRVAAAPVVAVVDGGRRPLPVALVENVAAGILFAATAPSCPPIVLQPDEGITTRGLFELFGARRFVSLPASLAALGLGALRRSSALVTPLTTAARGLELLFIGQRLAPSSLTAAGFVPTAGPEAWESLAEGVGVGAQASIGVAPAPAMVASIRR